MAAEVGVEEVVEGVTTTPLPIDDVTTGHKVHRADHLDEIVAVAEAEAVEEITETETEETIGAQQGTTGGAQTTVIATATATGEGLPLLPSGGATTIATRLRLHPPTRGDEVQNRHHHRGKSPFALLRREEKIKRLRLEVQPLPLPPLALQHHRQWTSTAVLGTTTITNESRYHHHKRGAELTKKKKQR